MYYYSFLRIPRKFTHFLSRCHILMRIAILLMLTILQKIYIKEIDIIQNLIVFSDISDLVIYLAGILWV